MLVDLLLSAAEKGAERPAVADPTQSLDYGTLVRFADVMRQHVEQSTAAPHVGLMLPSTCGFVGTFFGILWAKRTAVPLNFLLQPAELIAVVKDAGIDTVFAIKHFKELVEALPVKVIYLEDLPIKRQIVLSFAGTIPHAPVVDELDTAVLLYTSGTSGQPKGVCQTYVGLHFNVLACIEKAVLKRDHNFLGVLPLSHSFGLTAMMLAPLSLGASTYYMPRFTPTSFFQTAREQHSSITMTVASMYGALLRAKAGTREDLAGIEYAISGGEALPDKVYEDFKERFGIGIIQGYGMTEASPVVSLNVPWNNRVGTVGQAIPGVNVRAFDDSGKELPKDRDGELWVKGPNVMKGYFNKTAETQVALTEDGWYKTGDMGRLDADEFITITGRKKEMIIVGGENVYPREIENALEQHPAVAEAAVIGQKDPSRGEVVVAFVTLHEGATATEIALRDHCRDRIAGFKVPRRVLIRTDLPRSATGKILKRKLPDLLTGVE